MAESFKIGYFPENGNSVVYDTIKGEIIETNGIVSVVIGYCDHVPTADELPQFSNEFVYDYLG